MADARLDVRALYTGLDAKRQARELTWRQVAGEAGISPSTLTRLAQGKRPDVDSFASLTHWLGVSADEFLGSGIRHEAEGGEQLAVISSLLRAEKDLLPEGVEALQDIINAAYKALKRTDE